MQVKENTKTNWFNKFILEKSGFVGIILMFIVFLLSLIAHFVLHKISSDTMFILQVGAIVFILLFLLLDIQDKLDKIEDKINDK